MRFQICSTLILDSSESEQLQWLSGIYEFEVHAMRSKTTGLSYSDLALIHLSRIFSPEKTNRLMDQLYHYDKEKNEYSVPDGHWFSYNERWPSSNLTVASCQSALRLYIFLDLCLHSASKHLQQTMLTDIPPTFFLQKMITPTYTNRAFPPNVVIVYVRNLYVDE